MKQYALELATMWAIVTATVILAIKLFHIIHG